MNSKFLKIGFFAACIMLLTTTIHAQTSLDYVEFSVPGTPESIDTVTVGSRMPYFVAPQTPVTDMSFEYKWVFGPTSLAILDFDGDPLTTGGTANYYAENEISVVMPSAPGMLTVNTNVQSLVGGTVLCAPGADDTYNIQVVPVPTMVWKGTDLLLCGDVTSDVPVDIALTGYGQWMVNYEIVKSDLDGSSPGSPTSVPDVAIGTTANVIGTTPDDFTFLIDESNFSGVGLYKVTITQLTDRFSRKSLDLVNGTFPATSFEIKVYPTPTTNKLQHIKNMP